MPSSNDDAPVPTGIEALVCADIARRQAMGVRKYGTTLADNPAGVVERVQHLYEELLDGANYAKWVMQALQAQAGHLAPPQAPPAAPVFDRPVHVSLTVTAPSRTAAAQALRQVADALVSTGNVAPRLKLGEFVIAHRAGAVTQGELDEPRGAADTEG